MSVDAPPPPPRIDGYLVVGGTSHDMDHARLQLLGVLAAYPNLRVKVAPNYEDVEGIARSAFLITYTCDLAPSAQAQASLESFVSRGGRWFALHATNALLAFTPHGVAARGLDAPFLQTLGSQFLAHPPLGAFRVHVEQPSHPLVAGLEDFDIVDELYLSRIDAEVEVLLSTRFGGHTPNFAASDWTDDAPRPVFYLRRLGAGAVAYLTLGHARGRYDAPHKAAYLPQTEHDAWETPQFQELLNRGVRWSAGLGEFAPTAGAST